MITHITRLFYASTGYSLPMYFQFEKLNEYRTTLSTWQDKILIQCLGKFNYLITVLKCSLINRKCNEEFEEQHIFSEALFLAFEVRLNTYIKQISFRAHIKTISRFFF